MASTPAGAAIRLEGKDVGQTPLTVELKKGIHTIEAYKSGYVKTQHAFYVSGKDGNVVNLLLLPENQAGKNVNGSDKSSQSQISDKALSNLDTLEVEIQKIKSMILSNPEDAISLPIMQLKLGVQSEEIKALREDLKDVKELSKFWYWRR